MNTDFFIKDESYASVKVLTDKAKEFMNDQGFENALTYFGNNFCGEPVWTPDSRNGLYTFPLDVSSVPGFISFVTEHGLTVESEF